MKFQACFVALFVAVSLHLVLTQSPYSFQEEEIDPHPNITLENKYENNTGWTLPKDSFPKWFEYYNNISSFKNDSESTDSCSHIAKDFELPADAEGIWVACQDQGLSGDQKQCAEFVNSPCHPAIKFNTGTVHMASLRTIKMSFALYGLAVLRFTAPVGSAGDCFDYSWREDPFSPCEFLEVTETMVSDGWIRSQFTFDIYSNTSFTSFSVELIARFAQDVVILDKVEGSQYLLCKDSDCTTTPAPKTTHNSIWSSTNATTTTTATTEDDGISDPDVGPTTTLTSASSILLSSCIVKLTFTIFLIFFLYHFD